ncbi:hypothetical protein [Sediminitomix flava]|uniref:Uncharacterized protein n=1 Tax=Sediminitomix flava TaxID=379075 RepID=A0A315ZH49_SEDFL|nr:hypothetical protein [Sediminitomix flava]PWJ44460.1 hypothetical protein BC781_101831 [Sediminitomix flava]
MDRLLFSELLMNPQDVSLEHKEDLVKLTKKYPYFQAPQVLLALSDRTDTDQIKKAAAYSVNRSALKALINEDFNANVNLHNVQKLDIQTESINAFERLADNSKVQTQESTVQEKEVTTLVEEHVEASSTTSRESENHSEQTSASEPSEEGGVLAFLLSNVEEEEKSEQIRTSLFEEQEPEAIEENIPTSTPSPVEEENDELVVKDDDIGEIWASDMVNRLKGLEMMREELKAEQSEDVDKEINGTETKTEQLSEESEEELPLFNPFGKGSSVDHKKLSTDDSWAFELHKEMFPEHLEELEEKEEKMEMEEKKVIINNFINEKPRINIDRDELKKDIQDLAGQTSNHFMFNPSENFAKILVKQRKYKEAIHIYEELILKNPDKKSYFASCISEIKKES